MFSRCSGFYITHTVSFELLLQGLSNNSIKCVSDDLVCIPDSTPSEILIDAYFENSLADCR